MGLAATLLCPCTPSDTGEGFSYEAPPAGETRFDLGGAAYRRRYRVCATCGHWFGEHDLDLSALYTQGYVDATYGGAQGLEQRFRKIMALPPERSDNRQRVIRVGDYAAGRGLAADQRRLLDVGAGLGVFPAAMKALGWEVVGLEPDPRNVAHLRQVVGITALAERLEALDPAVTGRFTAITFNKVLEHVEDPVSLLAAALPLLADRGFIYIEVPDVAAAVAGPGREEFFIEHHHVFSPDSLTLLVERAGFALTRIERVHEPSGKYTIFAFAAHGLAT
jgi:SAM-dependent methyltransferase